MAAKAFLKRAAFAVMMLAFISSSCAFSMNSGSWSPYRSGAPSGSFGNWGASANTARSGNYRSGSYAPSFAASSAYAPSFAASSAYRPRGSPAYTSFAASPAYVPSPSYSAHRASSAYNAASFSPRASGSGFNAAGSTSATAYAAPHASTKGYYHKVGPNRWAYIKPFQGRRKRSLTELSKDATKKDAYPKVDGKWEDKSAVEREKRSAPAYTVRQFQQLITTLLFGGTLSAQDEELVTRLTPEDLQTFNRVKKEHEERVIQVFTTTTTEEPTYGPPMSDFQLFELVKVMQGYRPPSQEQYNVFRNMRPQDRQRFDMFSQSYRNQGRKRRETHQDEAKMRA